MNISCKLRQRIENLHIFSTEGKKCKGPFSQSRLETQKIILLVGGKIVTHPRENISK